VIATWVCCMFAQCHSHTEQSNQNTANNSSACSHTWVSLCRKVPDRPCTCAHHSRPHSLTAHTERRTPDSTTWADPLGTTQPVLKSMCNCKACRAFASLASARLSLHRDCGCSCMRAAVGCCAQPPHLQQHMQALAEAAQSSTLNPIVHSRHARASTACV
jgi:hypothetical protein